MFDNERDPVKSSGSQTDESDIDVSIRRQAWFDPGDEVPIHNDLSYVYAGRYVCSGPGADMTLHVSSDIDEFAKDDAKAIAEEVIGSGPETDAEMVVLMTHIYVVVEVDRGTDGVTYTIQDVEPSRGPRDPPSLYDSFDVTVGDSQ